MKKIILSVAMAAASFGLTGCMQEFDPQGSTITSTQAGAAPGAYDNFVSTITSSLIGQFGYNPNATDANDFGMPAFFIMRDIMGQDIVPANTTGTEWFMQWYSYGVALGPTYAVCQMPWTYYYGWIDNCNKVLGLAGDEPDATKVTGAGIAHTIRAMLYMDLARMYAPKTYGEDKNAETVPYVSEKTTIDQLMNNPRLTNEQMWAKIIEDLDIAEQQLEGYKRPNNQTPDVSVVYGLKARAYLVMEDWKNAEKYAKLAQVGYQMLSPEQYTDRATGFNTSANGSWMFSMKYKSDDPNIKLNDGDSSWGSWMILEIDGFGYASSYGAPKMIDRHLYETIPATDCRKKCYVDFALDELGEDELMKALGEYTDYPDLVATSGFSSPRGAVGGLALKFRATGGDEGHSNQYVGLCVEIPFMRVEEMMLIEAEAVGMQAGREQEGISLLTAFAKQRDANYTYGTHNDAYGNTTTSAFQNEIWWERRVEFWGEGMATFDIKRLSKSVVRSYPGTNHTEGFRWNSTGVPDAMNYCIIQTETNYNKACTNNPTPSQPSADSPEYVW